MTKKMVKVSTMLLSLGGMLFANSINAEAIASHASVGHSSGVHASTSRGTVAHTTTSHASVSTHTPTISARSILSMSKGVISHSTSISSQHISSNSTRVNNVRSSSVHVIANKPLSKQAVTEHVRTQFPRTKTTLRSISQAESSATYRSLTRPDLQSNYVFWRTYSDSYYRRSMFEYYYPWMPFWLWNLHDNKESTEVRNNAQKHHMKWIKVNDQTIAVPSKIYRKIKVGDTIELINNSHIKVNSTLYSK